MPALRPSNINGLGPIPVVSRLESPVEAGDLVDIKRVTFLRSQFVLQELTDADLAARIRENLGDTERGPPGLPGASAVLRYDTLVEGAVTLRGQYRFRLEGSDDGTIGHTGLTRARKLDLYNFDRGGLGHEDFFGLLKESDVVVLFVDSRRWYAYTLDDAREANAADVSTLPVTFLNGEFDSGTDDLSTDELTVLFRFSRPRLITGSQRGVTGPEVIASMFVTTHMAPVDFDGDPITWPLHRKGAFFRNNAGPVKYLVATVFENGRALSKDEHVGYIYSWTKDGAAFVPAVADPIVTAPPQDQLLTRRWLAISAEDVEDGGENLFRCRARLP